MTNLNRKHLTPKMEKLRGYEATLTAMRSEIELSEEAVTFLDKILIEISDIAAKEKEEFLEKKKELKKARDAKRNSNNSSKTKVYSHPGTATAGRSVFRGLAGKTSGRNWKEVK